MDDRETIKSVVRLNFFDRTNRLKWSHSSGVMVNFRDNGKYILSTCHQFDTAYGLNLEEFPKQNMGVEVGFYNCAIIKPATVVAFDRTKDLSLVWIPPCQEFEVHPLSCIKPATSTGDTVQRGQKIYCFHHPSMFVWEPHPHNSQLEVESLVEHTYQYGDGRVVEPNLYPEIFHFYMPHIRHGSSGAPIFDLQTNKLVGLVQGADHGYMKSGKTIVVTKLKAISMSRINEFIVEKNAIIEAANAAYNADHNSEAGGSR